ncbi:MAG: adenylate/guanylate cyclase domain-containing protein [Candidatus Kapaibacterium sp.]
MKILLILLCLSFSINHSVFAAGDSLLAKWHNKSLSDSARISAYDKYIFDQHINKNSDSVEFHLEQLLNFSKAKNSYLGLSSSSNIRGVLELKSGNYDKAIEYFEVGLRIGDENKSNSIRASSLSFIAIANYYKGNFEIALTDLKSVIILYKELQKKEPKYIVRLASIYVNIGSVYKELANYKKALENYQGALKIYVNLDEKEQISAVYNNLGLIYKEKGEYVNALEYFDKSINIKSLLDNWQEKASTFHNIGLIYMELNELDKALEFINKSIKIEKEKKNIRGLANSYVVIGDILMEKNKYNEALEYLENSLEINQKIGDKSGIAFSLMSIGKLYSKQNDFKKAESYFERSLNYFEEIGELKGISNVLSFLGLLEFKKGDLKSALANCKRSESIAMKSEDIVSKKQSCECLYQVYKKTSQPIKALQYYERMIGYSKKMSTREASKELQRIEFQKAKLADSLRQEKMRMTTKLKYENRIAEENQERNIALAFGLILVLVAGGLFSRNRYIRKTKDVISLEKDRSQNLLLNILPAEIARELMEKGKSAARDFENVTIMFTDFKEFTQASEKLTAHELVEEINYCFEKFDGICEKYRIEKIKTIGDSYMAAGGLPVPYKSSTKNTVLAGIEMQEFIIKRAENRQKENQICFEMRIGIHSGPVVAGIVGVKKFQYDIWGDTVNTASRMESAGEVHRINIGHSTYNILKDDPDFVFEHRGKINAKGKGEVDMYFVELKK